MTDPLRHVFATLGTSGQSNMTKGRIAAAHGQCSPYFIMGRPFPRLKIAPSHGWAQGTIHFDSRSINASEEHIL